LKPCSPNQADGKSIGFSFGKTVKGFFNSLLDELPSKQIYRKRAFNPMQRALVILA